MDLTLFFIFGSEHPLENIFFWWCIGIAIGYLFSTAIFLRAEKYKSKQPNAVNHIIGVENEIKDIQKGLDKEKENREVKPIKESEKDKRKHKENEDYEIR